MTNNAARNFTPPKGFRAIERPSRFIAFSEIGQSVQGTYCGTEEVNGRQRHAILIDDSDGAVRLLPDNVDLDLKLAGVPVGTRIYVEFAGFETLRNGREMKRYLVAISDGAAP